MIPKQKAIDLIAKSRPFAHSHWDENKGFVTDELSNNSKAIAKLIVAETIEALNAFGYTGAMYDDFETGSIYTIDQKDPVVYWNNVLSEIDLL